MQLAKASCQRSLGLRPRQPLSIIPHTSSLYNHNGWRTEDSIPQARLVASGRLVRPTQQLEEEHGHRRPDHLRHHCHCVEDRLGAGVPSQDARARALLPEQILEQADHRVRKGAKGQGRGCGREQVASKATLVMESDEDGLCDRALPAGARTGSTPVCI